MSSCESEPETLFEDTDFELCTLPLPSGYPLSWTHAGIEYVKDSFNGYQYFLTCSPYPNYNDDFENPMFYYANARKKNFPPTEFIPYRANPLQNDPGDGYNADPDVIYTDSSIYVINRPYIRPDSIWVNIQKCLVDSDGGFEFTKPIILYTNKQKPYNFGFPKSCLTTLVSPSIVKYNGVYRCYQLVTNSYNDNSDCKGIVIMEGNSLDHTNSLSYLQKGEISNFRAKPWHIDVFSYKNKLYAVICAYVHEDYLLEHIPYISRFFTHERKCHQYLAVSEDGMNFKVFDKPLTKINSYRSSAFVREDGLFVIYISTLGYKPKGNQSEDGRNIMVAYKPFEDILKKIK